MAEKAGRLWRHWVVYCLVPGLFKPFGINLLPEQLQWQHAFFFGAVTFAVSSVIQIMLPAILPPLFKEGSWQSWKEIVYLLFTTGTIGAANFWLMYYLYPQNHAAAGFLKAQLMTLEIGIFPILFIVFTKQLTLYRRFAAEAKEVMAGIHVAETGLPSQPALQPLLLHGNGQKEALRVAANDLLFMASADNYISVYYREAGLNKSTLLRGSLKKMEEQLHQYSHFFRCHRMYLVNLQGVEKVSGNAQGLRLYITGVQEPVPVSRSLTTEVKSRLHQLSHSPQNAM